MFWLKTRPGLGLGKKICEAEVVPTFFGGPPPPPFWGSNGRCATLGEKAHSVANSGFQLPPPPPPQQWWYLSLVNSGYIQKHINHECH